MSGRLDRNCLNIQVNDVWSGREVLLFIIFSDAKSYIWEVNILLEGFLLLELAQENIPTFERDHVAKLWLTLEWLTKKKKTLSYYAMNVFNLF